MVSAILGIVAALLAALPKILTLIEAKQAASKKESDALTQRSLSELHAVDDGMPKPPPM